MILCYHRVAEPATDPQLLAVTPRRFSEQLEAVREVADVVSLSRLVQDLASHSLRGPRVVVTFDDGYADNLLAAKPVLERLDVPATVFVTSGYVGCHREFWWDELERILLAPGTLPSRLELTVVGRARSWDLGEDAVYPESTYHRQRTWSVLERRVPSLRHGVYRSLLGLLRPLPDEAQQSVLVQLRAWAGSDGTARPGHRTLTAREVTELERGGLVEIGAHTITHPVLALLPRERQQTEIAGSRARVGELANAEVQHFSYPYGVGSRVRRLLSGPRAPSRRPDFTPATVALVRDSGFESACTTTAGTVGRSTSAVRLPRLLVRDWDGDGLARRLRELLGG